MAFEDDFFSNVIVLVEEGANKKESAYWTTRRPVPLTDEEREGYHEKDSIARLKESESYLDSVDAENSRFKPGKFFFPGYVYTDRYHKRSYRISPLLGGVKFNTVEGLAVERSEEHTSELQSLMRISYAVFCLKKKNKFFDKILYTSLILNQLLCNMLLIH